MKEKNEPPVDNHSLNEVTPTGQTDYQKLSDDQAAKQWLESLPRQYEIHQVGQKATVGLPGQAEHYFRYAIGLPLGMVCFALVIAILIMSTRVDNSYFWWFSIIGIAAIIVGTVFTILKYPKAKYTKIRWRFDEQGLLIYRGVWWRKQLAVPRSRVQHIDVVQGPLLGSYDLGQLVIHTAGTTNASVTLTGLTHSQAQILRDDLLSQDSNDSV